MPICGGKLSHTEVNILKTMITVTVVFVLFRSATSLANFLLLFGVSKHMEKYYEELLLYSLGLYLKIVSTSSK